MALGGVPGLMDLGVDGQGLGALGTLGRGDEEEKKRQRWIQVMDILKVWLVETADLERC